jgi:aminomethyltransferase
MGLVTPLHKTHVDSGATLVDFGGWDMPLHYGSQLAEHRAVRQDAGMFDVSHMCVIDVNGSRAREFLRKLLANDVAKLKTRGKALYSCMLLPSGGVIDDLIVYFIADSSFRLVVNAGTRDKDLAWILDQARGFDLEVRARTELAMIAIQGPNARAKVASLLPAEGRATALDIAPFVGVQIDGWFVARTGYTGEDGFEIMLPAEQAAGTWRSLIAAGVVPAGLGARDTLRLEAGLNLYGNDMDETRHPLESGLEWTVAFEPAERQFIGREALERVKTRGCDQLVGLLLEDRGVLRSHQKVITGNAQVSADRPGVGETGDGEISGNPASSTSPGSCGEVTSGTFSPTLNRSIALARVPRNTGPRVEVDIRGKLQAARIVKPPFVRHGKVLVQI